MRGVFITVITAAIVIAGCNSKTAVKQKIEKPRASACQKPSSFRINPRKDTLIQVPGGTQIKIPANTIADKNGKIISDSVRIDYSEYTNPASILLSGIPMLYDSAGEMNVFRSAGMFEIYAKGENEESFTIAPGKSINVNMASPIKDEGSAYSFYNFDTVTGKWNYLATAPASPLPAPTKDTIEIEKSTAKVKYTSSITETNEFVFDFKVNYSDIPELKNKANVMWKYSKNKNFPDPEKQQWIFDEVWDQASIENDPNLENAYLLILKSSKKVFTTSVFAVIPEGKNSVNIDSEIDKINTKSDLAQQVVANEDRQTNVSRAFSITGFGIFNWDAIHRFLNPVKKTVEFLTDGKKISNGSFVYQIFPQKNIVFRVPPVKENTIVPDEEFSIIAILPNGEIAHSINTNALRNENNGSTINFSLKKTGVILKSEDDILAYLYN